MERPRCFVVIDLKTKPFKPEYAGKMNFYLSANLKTALPAPGDIEAEFGKGKRKRISKSP